MPTAEAWHASAHEMHCGPHPSDQLHVPAGFQPEYKLASPEVLFTKHVRCLFRHGTSSWETDMSQPLCSDEEVLHPDPRWGGVPVCPVSVVQDVMARNNVTAQP